jgi:large repetitive protein
MQSGLARSFFSALLAGVLGGTVACSDIGAIHRCNDGLDNDLDGLVDYADPGCVFHGTDESPDPVQCNDGIDNDGDGLIDYPEDPGCLSEDDPSEFDIPPPACSDGIDNDGDGLIDYPFDPGCFLPIEDSEEDGCDGSGPCPACGDGIDNDGDGRIDFPADPGCSHAGDTDEFNLDPGACGGDLVVKLFPEQGEAVGVVRAGSEGSLESHTCGGEGSESAWAVRVLEPATLRISTAHPTTTADTVIYLRRDCQDPTTELACNDNASEGVTSSRFMVDVPVPGTYYLVVDAASVGTSGGFRASVEYFTLTGAPCNTSVPNCAPGQTCRPIVEGGGPTLCLPPQCSDGYDNDGDGFIDYPYDPGCSSPTDTTEDDECPGGTTCPACGNGIDDDGDGRIDFPADIIGCTSAGDDSEEDECIPGIPVLEYPPGGLNGTTPPSGSGRNNFNGSCDPTLSPTEDIYGLPVYRKLRSLTFSTLGSVGDTVLFIRYGDCASSAAEIACYDPGAGGESITLDNPKQGLYFVFVDGDFASNLNYRLDITGVIGPGDACDPGDIMYTCSPGYACDPDSNTCVVARCNDGIDNDGDGLIDYPNDPGCTTTSDHSENDDCPTGPNCPACGNGVDDDFDGLIDYPADPGCDAAGDPDEIDACIPGIYPMLLPIEGVSGTTPPSSTGSKFTPSCHTSTASTEDVYYFPLLRDLTSLTFSTEGSAGDTVLSVRHPGCGIAADELACNHLPASGEAVTLPNPVPGIYYVFVDGDFVSGINYVLNVRGTIAPGSACDPDDTRITCESGYACDPAGMTCVVALCNNGIDDDGDGFIDFPEDPGCETTSDHDETDDCPTGPDCPQCSNGIDDDGDGYIDYGEDIGCVSASDDDELDECIPGVPVIELTDAGLTGTTPPSSAGSKFTPSCQASTTATEVVHAYRLMRDLTTLTFSTVGSTGNTVLSIRHGDCGSASSEIACANITPGGEAITLVTPTPGIYYVFVDGSGVSGISYVLNVSGAVAPGGACDPASTQFTCASGYVCDPDSLTCEAAACNNGVDDDGDGFIDYPEEPGCASPSDNDESDDCPMGPLCAQCSNLLDDDGDTAIDYPADIGCMAAGDENETTCAGEADPVELVTGPIMTGSTATLTHNFTPSCTPTSTARDKVYLLRFPGYLTNLTVDTNGSLFDTVLMIKEGECTAADLACDDDGGVGTQSLISLAGVAPGQYVIIVDGYSTGFGAYTLNVSGTIAEGQRCDPAQTASGMFTCAGGTDCQDIGSGYLCQ